MPEQLIDTRFPGQRFPRGERRHVPRPPPARRLRHGHRTAPPRSHRRRRRDRPTARALRWAPARQGRPHGRSDDAAGRRPCCRAARHLTTSAPATRWRFRFESARSRAGVCRQNTRIIALSVSYVLRAPWDDIRDTLLHEIAHAIVGPGHGHDAAWQTAARAHRLHGEALQHRHAQPEAVDGGVPPVPRPMVPPTPDGESTPTLDLPAVPLAHRLENQRPRERPLTRATRAPTCKTARTIR